jgi:hypothetical protein
VGELDGQDLARRHVVAVGEAAGDAQHLVALQEPGLLAEAVDVEPLRNGPGLLEGELGLDVAVGARRPQDQGPWGGHVVNLIGRGGFPA